MSEVPNSLKSRALLRVVDLLSEGEIVGLVDGDKSVYFGDTPLQNADNSYNFKNIQYETRLGTPTQDPIPGFDSVETETSVSRKITQTTANGGLGPYTFTVSDLNADAIRIKMRLPALIRTTNDGDIKTTSVQFTIEVQPDGGPWSTIVTDTIAGKTTSPYERDYRIDLPGNGPWQIRVTRVTDDSTNSKLTNELYLSSYTTLIDVKPTYPDSAVVGMVLPAESFGGSIPRRGYLIKGIKIQVPTNYDPVARTYATTGPGTTNGAWDGTFKTEWSDNPAWVYYDLVTHSRYGLGQYVPATMVDKYALYEIAKYCDGLVSDGFGGTEPRFRINVVITTAKEAYEVLQQITSVFRGMAYWAAGLVTAVQDCPKDPVQLVTPANVIDGEFTYQSSALKDRHTVAMVSWSDPDDQYRTAVEVVELPDAIERYGYRPVEIIAYGCTSRGQAYRTGRWLLDTEVSERETVTYTASFDHVGVRPGDIIEVADPKVAGTRQGGRIAAGSTTTAVNIDAPLRIYAGDTLTTVRADGSLMEAPLAPTGTAVTAITCTTPLPEAPRANAVWVIGGGQVNARPFRVVSVVENEKHLFEVTAVTYDPNKFARIEQNLTFDPVTYGNLGRGKVIPPGTITFTEGFYRVNNQTRTRLIIGWAASADPRLAYYEYRYLQPNGQFNPWMQTYSLDIEVPDAESGDWYFEVRAVTDDERRSFATTGTYTATGKITPTAAPTGLVASGGYASVGLKWTNPTDPDLDYIEVWGLTTGTPGNAVIGNASLIAEIDSTSFVHANLNPGDIWYYWVRAIDQSGNVSDWNAVSPVSATVQAASAAVAGFLTNESHTVATLVDGTGGTYTDAGGTFRVYDGTTDKTGDAAVQYSIVAYSGGLSASEISIAGTGVYTVTGLTSDIGTATLRAVYNGVTLDKVYSISKSKQGDEGGSGAASKVVTLTASSQLFKYDGTDTLNPTGQYITLSVAKQNTTNAVAWTTSPTVTLYDAPTGGSATTTGDVVYLRAADFNGQTAVTITASVTDGAVFSDKVTVVKVRDGAPGDAGAGGVVAFLTNESHVVPASSAGVVSSYAGASGTFKVYQGIVDKSTGNSITYSVFANVSNLTNGGSGVLIDSASGAFTIDGGFADGATVATVTFRATLPAGMGGGTIDKVFTLTKSKAGTNGTSAKTLAIRADRQIFTYDADNLASPSGQVIKLDAVKQNTTATVNWSTSPFVSLYNASTGGSVVTTGDTVYLRIADFAANTAVLVTASLTDGATITDTLSVVRVKDGDTGATGEPALYGYLTNETHTVPASAAGAVSSWAGAAGEFKILSGSTDVSSNFTLSTFANPAALTVGYVGRAYTISDAGTAAGQFGNADTDTASLTIRATGSGAFAGKTIDKVFTITKSKAGAAGVNAKVLTLSATAQSFTFDKTGAAAPTAQTVVFTANTQNLSGGAYTWTATKYNSAGGSLGAIAGFSADSATRSLTLAQFDVAAYVIVEVSYTGGYTDRMTIVRLKDGADGSTAKTIQLTATSQVFPFKGNESTFQADAPASIVVTASLKNVVDPVTWSASDNGGSVSIAGWTVGTNPDTLTVTQANFGTTRPYLRIRCTSSTDANVFDELTIHKISDGTDGLTAHLTNETHACPADADGLNPDIAGATGQFKVYLGDSDKTSNCTFSILDATGCTAQINNSSNQYFTGPKGAYRLTSLTAENATVLFQATYSIWRYTFTTTKLFSITKARKGVNGTDALIGYLTNEAHTLVADSGGTVADYTGASGTFKVYLGTSDVTSGCTFALKSGGNPQNLTYSGPTNGTGAYSVTAGFDAGENTASITWVATHTASGGTVEKTFTLAKSKSGAAGSNAKLVRLISSGQVFKYDTNNSPTGASSISFTVYRENTTAAVTWTTQTWNGSSWVNATQRLTGTSDTGATLTEANFAAAGQPMLRFVASVTDGSTYSDSITIAKVTDGEPGADAKTVRVAASSQFFKYTPAYVGKLGFDSGDLSGWSAQNLTSASLNTTYSYDNIGGSVRLYATSANADSMFVFTTNFKPKASTIYVFSARCYVESATASALENRALAIYDGVAAFNVASGLDQTTPTGQWIYYSVALTTSANPAYLELRLYCPQGVVYWDDVQIVEAAPNSQTITLTASRQNITSAVSWTTTPGVTLVGSGDTVTLPIANFNNNQSVKIRATVDGLYDEVTLYKLVETSDAPQGAGPVTFIQHGTDRVEINSDSFFRAAQSTAVWDTGVYSKESYRGGVYVSGQPVQYGGETMLGLDSSPAGSANYDTIDYAWYWAGNGHASCYENGIGGYSGVSGQSANSVYSIVYDGAYVRYYIDGTLMREVWAGAGRIFQLDSAVVNAGQGWKNIKFGPVSSVPFTAALTNEAHTLPADSQGNVVSYTGASGYVKLYAGAKEVNLAESGLSVTVQDNPQSLTYGGSTSAIVTSSTGGYQVDGGFDASESSATATFRVTILNGPTIDKIFTLTKSKQGSSANLTPPDTFATWYSHPSAQTMGGWESYNALATSQVISTQVGPTGDYPLIFRTAGDNSTWHGNGGLRHWFPVDPKRAYVSYVWVRRRTSDSNSLYVGFSEDWSNTGNYIRALDGNIDQNPYHISGLNSQLTAGKWYLTVGVIQPSGHTAGATGLAGMWDPDTGARVVQSSDYMNSATATMQYLRFFYYVYQTPQPSDRGFDFLPVGTWMMDGSHPTVDEVLGYRSTGAVTLIPHGTGRMQVLPNRAYRTDASAGWDTGVYSLQSYNNGAYCAARADSTSVKLMFGLNTDPTTAGNYETLDYAWYLDVDSAQAHIYESNSYAWGSTGFSPSDVFSIQYDGSSVRYMKNGTVMRTVTGVAANQTFYFDSSFYGSYSSNGINSIVFTPAGAVGEDGQPGVSPTSLSVSPLAIQVVCDQFGTPKSGVMPKYATVKVYSGTTDVTGSASVNVNNKSAGVTCSYSGGQVTISVIGGDNSWVDVSATYNSQTVVQRISLTKLYDSPPPTSATMTFNQSVVNSSSSTYNTNGPVLTHQASGTGKLRLNYYLNYQTNAVSGATCTLQVKLQYRIAGGTFADVPNSEAIGTESYYNSGDWVVESGFSYPPNSTYVDLTGLTAGANYEIRVATRRYSGTNTCPYVYGEVYSEQIT